MLTFSNSSNSGMESRLVKLWVLKVKVPWPPWKVFWHDDGVEESGETSLVTEPPGPWAETAATRARTMLEKSMFDVDMSDWRLELY